MRKHAVVPPFRALDPELGVAERLLRKENPQLCAIVAQLPDEHAAARRLNAVLAAAGARPRLVDTGAAWRIVYVTPRPGESELAAAAAGLAELVTVGGWRRVKRCAVCARPFCDRTSGCTRKWCAEHRRAPRGVD
ncbi:ABATE domain-containing protein [Amycolatopsis australiensis]|uniref:Putative stress-induced transcription regulator n=1 Tax=Amycolatopsis australiensis TaxID=546364 RepID=A0A1K1QH25_9PSEU|nr:ABATE domain-containing protein [Amycolatopsis australiensis]SFW59256.1 Putative stress-induced transcription regulator [Amycolatopsis australiensis]